MHWSDQPASLSAVAETTEDTASILLLMGQPWAIGRPGRIGHKQLQRMYFLYGTQPAFTLGWKYNSYATLEAYQEHTGTGVQLFR